MHFTTTVNTMNTQHSHSNSHAANALNERFDAMKADLKKMIDSFESSPKGLLKSVTQSIKSHPLAAAAIAFGVGYLVLGAARRHAS